MNWKRACLRFFASCLGAGIVEIAWQVLIWGIAEKIFFVQIKLFQVENFNFEKTWKFAGNILRNTGFWLSQKVEILP